MTFVTKQTFGAQLFEVLADYVGHTVAVRVARHVDESGEVSKGSVLEREFEGGDLGER